MEDAFCEVCSTFYELLKKYNTIELYLVKSKSFKTFLNKNSFSGYRNQYARIESSLESLFETGSGLTDLDKSHSLMLDQLLFVIMILKRVSHMQFRLYDDLDSISRGCYFSENEYVFDSNKISEMHTGLNAEVDRLELFLRVLYPLGRIDKRTGEVII